MPRLNIRYHYIPLRNGSLNQFFMLALMVISVLLASCDTPRHDSRLEKIAGYVAVKSKEAVAALDSIDPAELDKPNRAYYNLLTIKARDKDYVIHTSDSLILYVIKFYTRHHNDSLTPEALYYGGRVYSDLGDYPTSLDYFHKALDMLPENTPYIILRGNVLSQTGGLLMDLGMFRQAIPYINSVIEINKRTNDTLNLAYNNRMLGTVFMQMQEYDSAEYYFRKSLANLKSLPSEFGIDTKVFQAANKYEQGDIDSALVLIRPTINNVSREFDGYTLACASEIYLGANSLDTAYLISHSLATDTNLDNRKSGYAIMLSPELRKYIPVDSLEYFLTDYRRTMENHYFNRQSDETLIQNSRYNYQVHDRNRRKAEIRSRDLTIYLLIAVCSVLAILVGVHVMLLRKRNKIIELQATVGELNKIIETIGMNNDCSPADQNEEPLPSEFDKALSEQKITEQSLKNEITAMLIKIRESSRPAQTIPDSIINSDAYRIIRKHIAEKTLIPSSDYHIWGEIEKIVLQQSPEFINRLSLLLGGLPDEQTLRLTLLIKCGVNSAQSGRLLGRSKSTISYRRAALCAKILGENSESTYLDDVIRAL